MSAAFDAIVASPAVLAARARYAAPALAPNADVPLLPLGTREQTFIAARDSFYLATVGESGWPHVQHRGGPRGFLQVLSPTRIGFADYAGNRQYVSVGNLTANDRAALILVDYPQRRRLKILGRVRIVDGTALPTFATAALPGAGKVRIERFLFIDVAAWDWNCSQHISPRYTADEWSFQSGTNNAFPQPTPETPA
ncbi:MAG: pyridoxamine 5'-phosphate oxidase family protein [Burkholderiales bacterium]|jgi:predicted pyridoxine 5'-phosphate oxidase superfamily flavin-nucleotide-binding protein|nr:pyridoxamine 5'-phosphate oxidase family protein [Burkholderiales bacterium]